MVLIPRGATNAEPAMTDMEQPKTIRKAGGTTHVLIFSTEKVEKASLQRELPSTYPVMATSSTSSEYDLSLTSPSASEISKRLATSTPRKKQGSADPGERTVSSTLRTLAPKPFANVSGSCQNPIIVEEIASPPRQAVRAQKRKPRHKKLTKSHQSIGNGYRDPYSYHPSRTALTAIPPNGSTFTGHQSHDIYRMMNAKITAAPNASPNAAWGRHTLNVPFEVQYPLSSQVFMQQQNTSEYQSPYSQNHQAQIPPNTYGYPTVPSQSEDLLRRRAIHYIQEFSRHTPLKRWLSDAGPEKTSGDEAEGHEEHVRPQPNSSTAQSHSMPPSTIRNIRCYINHKPTTHQDPDPDLLVRHLIEHTSLITSLLQLCPHSTDPKGLKNDISMMVQIQNQYVTEWMKAESLDSHKRRKIDGDNTVSLDDRLRPVMTSATRSQNEKDDMLRQVLSADADMWQDGTGHGVADVFAVVPASPPLVNSLNGRIVSSTLVPSIRTAHDLPVQEQSRTTGNSTTTPIKQTSNSTAGAAHWKGLSVTSTMEEIHIRSGSPSTSPKNYSKSSIDLSHPSSPSKDLEVLTRVTSHPADSLINPPPKRMNSRSPPHSKHATIQHTAPNSDDEVHIANNSYASGSSHSENSNDLRLQKPSLSI
ncbi:unnamed protein product [Alternaria burnsii]|nr:unnamed protein product [Alternaria burnsii]